MGSPTEIIISGREVKVPSDRVTYDQVVTLWNDLHKDEGLHIVGTPGIAYKDGAKDEKGVLLPGKDLQVKDGTSFTVDPEHVS